MSAEKRVLIDLTALEKECNLEQRAISFQGKTLYESIWTPEAMLQVVDKCKAQAHGAQIAEIQGHVPSWVLAAIEYAILPTVSYMELGPGGLFKLTSKAFPISADAPSCGVQFTINEQNSSVYISVDSDDPAGGMHSFDLNRFDEIVMPPITGGKDVFLSGSLVNPVIASAALSCAPSARAVYVRFHEEPNYYCVASNTEDVSVGDAVAAH